MSEHFSHDILSFNRTAGIISPWLCPWGEEKEYCKYVDISRSWQFNWHFPIWPAIQAYIRDSYDCIQSINPEFTTTVSKSRDFKYWWIFTQEYFVCIFTTALHTLRVTLCRVTISPGSRRQWATSSSISWSPSPPPPPPPTSRQIQASLPAPCVKRCQIRLDHSRPGWSCVRWSATGSKP